MDTANLDAIQACGESFYRAYKDGAVVMTANVVCEGDEFGFIEVSPIWSNCGAVGSAMFNAAIEAIRNRVRVGPRAV